MFKELYQYRELLKTNVKKEIRGKYKASVLGVFWSFINPLLQVLVYAIVFPYMLRDTGDNYIIYLITGIIPWTFFSTALTSCVGCIKNNSGIIKKVYFPREILPISAVVSGFVNFLISCLIVLIFCVAWGVGISWHILFVPVIALIEGILILGLGMALGAMDAYVQDLEYLVNFILTLAFYGTPIVYRLDTFGNTSLIARLVRMNPVTTLMNAYRDVFMNHVTPDFASLGVVFLISVVVLVIGVLIFKKLEKGFAEQF